MITYKILKKVQVPYRPGHDITATMTDDVTGKTQTIIFYFKSEKELLAEGDHFEDLKSKAEIIISQAYQSFTSVSYDNFTTILKDNFV